MTKTKIKLIINHVFSSLIKNPNYTEWWVTQNIHTLFCCIFYYKNNKKWNKHWLGLSFPVQNMNAQFIPFLKGLFWKYIAVNIYQIKSTHSTKISLFGDGR